MHGIIIGMARVRFGTDSPLWSAGSRSMVEQERQSISRGGKGDVERAWESPDVEELVGQSELH